MLKFDAYREWLGLPSAGRPPTYYQLLDIVPDESDAEVIKEAALRQTARARVYQVGPHGELCTRILNEIAQARATLLNPRARREYDAHLAIPPAEPQASRIPVAAAGSQPSAASVSFPAQRVVDNAARTVTRRQRGSRVGHWLGALVYLMLLVFAGAGSYWITAHGLPTVAVIYGGATKAAPNGKSKSPSPAPPVRGGKAP
jgi:hypothetical protein